MKEWKWLNIPRIIQALGQQLRCQSIQVINQQCRAARNKEFITNWQEDIHMGGSFVVVVVVVVVLSFA
jgi:hypothetical protein